MDNQVFLQKLRTREHSRVFLYFWDEAWKQVATEHKLVETKEAKASASAPPQPPSSAPNSEPTSAAVSLAFVRDSLFPRVCKEFDDFVTSLKNQTAMLSRLRTVFRLAVGSGEEKSGAIKQELDKLDLGEGQGAKILPMIMEAGFTQHLIEFAQNVVKLARSISPKLADENKIRDTADASDEKLWGSCTIADCAKYKKRLKDVDEIQRGSGELGRWLGVVTGSNIVGDMKSKSYLVHDTEFSTVLEVIP